ncbi:MAG TPA: hypothetical protein VLA31_08020 [Burkholderiaceae bacterium]|jgi:hypothetical protein|nr:hypothetical protein [Burkholderiaceae bacterium]
MTIIGSSLQQGMTVLQQMLGAPMFIWEGSSIRCIPAMVTDANTPVPGGFQDNVASRILVKFSDWKTWDSTLVTMDTTLYTLDQGTEFSRLLKEDGYYLLQENTDRIALTFCKPRPVVGRTLVYQGRTLRILSCRVDASGAYYSLELGAKTR